MKLFRFDYELPETLIAQDVTDQRDHSRLLFMKRGGKPYKHGQFSEITGFMKAGDLLVLNNTKVMAALTSGFKTETGGLVEVLFIEPVEPNRWLALLKSSKRPKPGTALTLGSNPPLAATFVSEGQDGECVIEVPPDRDIPLARKQRKPPAPSVYSTGRQSFRGTNRAR